MPAGLFGALVRRMSIAVGPETAHTGGVVCTRDWQRDPNPHAETAPATWADQFYAVIVDQDGSLRRTFHGCTCASVPRSDSIDARRHHTSSAAEA